MAELPSEPADCSDEPKLTAEEWAFIKSVAAEEADQGGDPQ